jgi:hypothetical protein
LLLTKMVVFCGDLHQNYKAVARNTATMWSPCASAIQEGAAPAGAGSVPTALCVVNLCGDGNEVKEREGGAVGKLHPISAASGTDVLKELAEWASR